MTDMRYWDAMTARWDPRVIVAVAGALILLLITVILATTRGGDGDDETAVAGNVIERTSDEPGDLTALGEPPVSEPPPSVRDDDDRAVATAEQTERPGGLV